MISDSQNADNGKDTSSKKKKEKRIITILPSDFEPGETDILVGRGKKCYDHIGNQTLRKIVNSKLNEYSTSQNKFEKSRIISELVRLVRGSQGGFVKQDPQNEKVWYDVGDREAKRKVAQTFRDALSDQYRSSYIFKNEKRKRKESSPTFTINSTPSCNLTFDDDDFFYNDDAEAPYEVSSSCNSDNISRDFFHQQQSSFLNEELSVPNNADRAAFPIPFNDLDFDHSPVDQILKHATTTQVSRDNKPTHDCNNLRPPSPDILTDYYKKSEERVEVSSTPINWDDIWE